MSGLDARAIGDGHFRFWANSNGGMMETEIVNRLNSIGPVGKLTGTPGTADCVFTCHTLEMGLSFAKFLKKRDIKISDPREAEGGGMYSVTVHADYELVAPLYTQFNDECFFSPQPVEVQTD